MNKFRLLSLFTLLVLLLTACPAPGTTVGKVTGLTTTAQAGSILVEWDYPTANNADIEGFQVWRNPDKDGNAKFGLIKTVSDVTQRNHTDEPLTDIAKKYYYGVAIIAKDGALGDRVDQPTTGPGTSPNPDTGGNTAPVAVADSYSVVAGDTLTVTAANGVLKNDTDADSDPLKAVKGTDPTKGTLTLNANGNGGFTYVADASASGSDSFTYTANDGEDGSNTATVTITIGSSGDPAPDGTYKTLAGVKLEAGTTATGTAVKAAGLTVGGSAAITTEPTNGTVDLNTDGTFTYTPDAGATDDSFTYTVGADTGTVSITIEAANIVNAATLTAADGAPAGSIIVLASGTYTCISICITMEKDQTLVGEGSEVAIGDITLSTGTGTKPVLDDADTAAIVLVTSDTPATPPASTESPIDGGNLTVTGISITNAGFRGITGMDRLTGTITVSDVDIDMSPAAEGAFHIRETYNATTNPHRDPPTGGDHDLIIDDLVITGADNLEGGFRANDFKTLTLTNSSVAMKSGRGVFIESEFNSTATLEGVTVTVAGTATNSQAFRFLKNNVYENGADTTDMNLIIKNTTATLSGASASETTNTAYDFTVLVGQTVGGVVTVADDAGKIMIDSAASTLNSTNVIGGAGSANKVSKTPDAVKVTGEIGF